MYCEEQRHKVLKEERVILSNSTIFLEELELLLNEIFYFISFLEPVAFSFILKLVIYCYEIVFVLLSIKL